MYYQERACELVKARVNEIESQIRDRGRLQCQVSLAVGLEAESRRPQSRWQRRELSDHAGLPSHRDHRLRSAVVQVGDDDQQPVLAACLSEHLQEQSLQLQESRQSAQPLRRATQQSPDHQEELDEWPLPLSGALQQVIELSR